MSNNITAIFWVTKTKIHFWFLISLPTEQSLISADFFSRIILTSVFTFFLIHLYYWLCKTMYQYLFLWSCSFCSPWRTRMCALYQMSFFNTLNWHHRPLTIRFRIIFPTLYRPQNILYVSTQWDYLSFSPDSAFYSSLGSFMYPWCPHHVFPNL